MYGGTRYTFPDIIGAKADNMSFQIVQATADDVPDMAAIFAKAMAADPFWKAMNGPDSTFEQECAFNEQALRPRVGTGAEIGACQTWKVVDEEGHVTFPSLLSHLAFSNSRPRRKEGC